MDHPWPSVPPKNIIVRMPNWLGDAVMATPVLADLRAHFPNAAITAMCQGGVAQIIQKDPNLTEIFSFIRPSGWIHRTRHFEIIDPLAKGEYDLGLLLTNSFSSAWWFWFGKVKNRIGYKGNFRSFLLNKALPFSKDKEHEHQVITYKRLLEPLGIPLSDNQPTLYLTDEERDAAKELLSRWNIAVGEQVIIGINPGAAYGSAKCWPPERFKEVVQELIKDKKCTVLLFGDETGAPVVDAICSKMPEQVVNLAGKTSIRELMALISCCSVFLTNDSGPMHIASALNIPLLALFGSTNPTRTGPIHGRVLYKNVSCSPCYQRVCPIDFRCMRQIGVKEVIHELHSILQQT